MVMPRTLVRIGLSAQDLANVMGVSAADVSKAFKGMEEGMRVETITAALQKHKGLAEATAKDLQGTWDNFKNYLHFTFEEIGKDLEGPAKGFLALGAQAAQGIGGIVENLSKLSSVLPESVAGINSLGTAISILVSFYSPTYGLATALFLAATAAQSARAATEEGEAAGRTYEQTLQRQAVALEKSAGSNTELRHRIEDLQEAYSYGKITQDAFAKGLAEISIGIGQAVPRAATAVEDIRAKIRAAAQAALEGTKAYSDYTASMAKLDAMMDKARLMPSGATAGLGVFDQFPALSQQITDDLKRISDAAVAAENATGAVGKNIIDTLTGITPALQAPTVALMNHDELLKRIDVDSTSSLRAEADALGQVYERLVAMNAAGKATDQEVVAGFKAWEDAAKKADGTTGQLQERSKSAGLELGRTFNSATRDIADLITGTGSLDAVLKRLGTDLLHQGLSMALAPIKANLQGMFSGGVGGASAGAQEAAMAALNAAVVANTVATTTTGTVQTAAETANTAALMANTAAVIQQAMSSIGSVLGLAGFQEGGVVPHDMVARLHGGEMVLPPDISGPLRGSLAGGGSIGGGGAAVHFENCSFTGVTKSLVDDIWNSAVKGARRVGAKW
jgi:predicted transcriptional regulator